MRIFSYMIVVLSIIFFNSCGSTNHGECSLENKKNYIYQVFHDTYYWADKVPNLNISNYNSEQDLIDDLMPEEDHYSFLLNYEKFDQDFNSEVANDFGFLNATTNVKGYKVILFVHPNSVADKAGIHRSNLIYTLSQNKSKKTTLFEVISNDGSKREVLLKEQEYIKKEVANSKIIDLNGTRVGYFVLGSFIGKSINKDLDELFGYFKQENVNELIVDLRYNNGGDIDIAAHLATLISGEKSFSNIFQHHVYNQKYSNLNSDSYFESSSTYALNLDRVFIITTENTASASESVISALRASENKMEVITVGTKSYGKPYSMLATVVCDKVLFPIFMKNFNSDYKEDYDEGFAPTCKANDDLTHDFGDLNESSLKEAIYYINHESCSN